MSISSRSFIVFLHVRFPDELIWKETCLHISIKIDITLKYETVASIFSVIKRINSLNNKNDGGDLTKY